MREALQHADGLTVIGVLLRESEITSNDVMPELFTDIPQVFIIQTRLIDFNSANVIISQLFHSFALEDFF